MKILILHRIPYEKINYHLGINHDYHEVTYLGRQEIINTIPAHLRFDCIIRGEQENDLKSILNLIEGRSFDRIISLSEYELVLAAQLRERIGCFGKSVTDTLLVRDKVKMKSAVASAGVRVPQFLEISEFIDNPIQTNWRGKTVVKPKSGASSENVSIFNSTYEARKYIQSIENFNFSDYQIEEFITGDILHVDGLVEGGKIKVVLPSRYIGNCEQYLKGKPLGSVQIPNNEEINRITESALTAVKITDGAFHLELISSPTGLVFLEIANRVGGADVVKTFELATGVHLPSEELKIYIEGRSSLGAQTHRRGYFGWFVFPGHLMTEGMYELENWTHYKEACEVYHFNSNRLDDWKPYSHVSYQPMEVPLAGIVASNQTSRIENFLKKLFVDVRVKSISNRGVA